MKTLPQIANKKRNNHTRINEDNSQVLTTVVFVDNVISDSCIKFQERKYAELPTDTTRDDNRGHACFVFCRTASSTRRNK